MNAPKTTTNKNVPKKTLAGVVGILAASLLFSLTPEEESGRKVKVDIAPSGEATVTHISGRQYLKAYLDVVGVATACDGITRGVRMGQTYTEEQCADLLEQELIIHAEGIKRCSSPYLWRPGTEYQRVASVLMAYNIGVGGFCNSSLNKKKFAVGRMVEGCNGFLAWNKGGRPLKVINGLNKRRHREREICLTDLVAGKTPQNLRVRMEKYR